MNNEKQRRTGAVRPAGAGPRARAGASAGAVVLAAVVWAGVAAAQPLAVDEAAVVRYDGHAVVRLEVRTERELRLLRAIGGDVWCEARRGDNEVRIPPESMAALEESGLAHEVVVANLQEFIDDERRRLGAQGAGDGDWFADYKPLEAIEEYLQGLAALRPDLARRFEIGTSLEGRRIVGIRISSPARGQGRGCKPAVLLNATQHAREWIAPMTAMFIADALVQRYDSDPQIRELVDNVEFLIVPVVNPDGYVHTWTTDRMWRKNRRANAGGTFGVDLNRNWGYAWGRAGSSGVPSSQTYRGTAPFSEPETQRLRDLVLDHPNIRAHNDIHSFGDLILFPWGYTTDRSPAHAAHQELGDGMSAQMHAVHGRRYTPGPIYTHLYPISGGATDWVYGEAQAYSYLFELRGPGFGPAPGEIRPCAEENLPAALFKAQWVMERFPFRADFDGNCIYTVDDFLAFMDAFAARHPDADFNRDGEFTIDDFLAFMDAFAAGR